MTTDSTTETDASADHHLVPDVILFTFMAILLTIGSYELKKYLKLPVSPLLLLMGVVFRDIGEDISGLHGAVTRIDTLSPELVMLGILPALIFEAAFTTD